MISIKETIGIVIVFCIVYFILYLDNILNNVNCDCNTPEKNNISFKVPFIFALLSFVLYKIATPYIESFFNNSYNVKQNIIIDMVDF